MLFQQRGWLFVDVKHRRCVENLHAIQRQSVFFGAGTNLPLIAHQRHSHAQLLHRQRTAFDYLQRCIIPAECVDKNIQDI